MTISATSSGTSLGTRKSRLLESVCVDGRPNCVFLSRSKQSGWATRLVSRISMCYQEGSGWVTDLLAWSQEARWLKRKHMCKRHPKVIPRSPQSDPKVVQLSHKVAQGLTRSHKVPQGPKRSHKASQGLTRSHKVSQGLTWSHKVSQERIYFRSVWLGSDWFGFAIHEDLGIQLFDN